MTPPPGSDFLGKVCQLRRALYEMKQAPRAWFAKFSTALLQYGFSASPYDFVLFIRRSPAGIIILLLYVDDMVTTGDDTSGISDLQTYLHRHFDMKNLGQLHYFLGLEISDAPDGIYLSQAKYASDFISRLGLNDSQIVSTPLEGNCRLAPFDGTPLEDPSRYRQLGGSLIYLTVTRPDIAHAVHVIAQFMANPRTVLYAAVLSILHYVKGTLPHGLHFFADSPLVLAGFSDVDWVGDPTNCFFITGYCFFLRSSLVSWRNKKQTLVSRPSVESEYRAVADSTSELLWLRQLLSNLRVPQPSSTSLHYDSTSAIQISHNDVFHERTKHIEIDYHFVRQHVRASTVHLSYVSSEDQTVDIFTKYLFLGRFSTLLSKLKLVSILPP
ncbi:uncharacterized mitochondrial protein AtMg00810-like [Andrographis paniculata]|uniref:uncharacterized mitochondrial protein AtMg00810-like n=1 Tax=Andrographis paniculata TaxID=175694 RepID=UPI0021E87FCD|nr:uncharacterized mitochondrial protein AtMg00810-like [Andrographis paniculata]